MVDYSLRSANVDDKKAVYDFLIDSYFTDMPLYPACHINEPPSIDDWSELQVLSNGLTVLAVSEEDDVIGVAVNVVPKDVENMVQIYEPMKTFFETINKDSEGLLSQLENNTMELRILAVGREFRGKGISKTLIQESEGVGKRIDRPSIYAIATGAYVAAAFRSQKWKCPYTYNYKDYSQVEPNFIALPSPHDSLSIFVKEIL